MTSVYCVGLAVADFIFYVDAFPDGPEKFQAFDAAVVGGGGAANAAVAVSRLGARAQLGARLGQDSTAQTILCELETEGVDLTGIIQNENARSGFSSVLIDVRGERQIVNFRGSGLPDTPKPLPKDIDAVLVDTRWPTGAIAALEQARAIGVPGVVDAEAPIDGAILARASHVAFSVQGLRSLIGTGGLGAAVEEMAKGLGVWVCVTDGDQGVYYSNGGGAVHVPAFDVDVVDTLGAGDVWHGAFALALGQGKSEHDAVIFASAAAALKCTRPGGRNAAPKLAEVEAFLDERRH